jgi:hypothetical protein
MPVVVLNLPAKHPCDSTRHTTIARQDEPDANCIFTIAREIIDDCSERSARHRLTATA